VTRHICTVSTVSSARSVAVPGWGLTCGPGTSYLLPLFTLRLDLLLVKANWLSSYSTDTFVSVFMACEVLVHRCLDLTWVPSGSLLSTIIIFILVRILINGHSRSANVDIESFWWFCIWCITYFCEKGKSPTKQQLREVTASLFPMPGDAYGVRHNISTFHI
jgi:hypothetical protein